MTPTEKRVISNSEVQSFKNCRREWYLSWYKGFRPRHTEPIEKKHTGDRIHRALMTWYVPPTETRVDPRVSLEEVLRVDRNTLTGSLQASDRSIDSDDTLKTFDKAASLERIMIDGYMQWLEETGVDAHLTVIAPETYVEAPLGMESFDGREIYAVGKIDVRVRRDVDGARFFIDHKTVAAMIKLDELARNEQMKHYQLLEDLSDEEGSCDGALYNQLRRVKRSPRATPPFYDRVLVSHNFHTKESFRRRLIGTVHDMQDVEMHLDGGADHRDVAYPRPSGDCAWKCKFAAICTMFDDGSRVESLLGAHYVQDDPLHYYGQSREEYEVAQNGKTA